MLDSLDEPARREFVFTWLKKPGVSEQLRLEAIDTELKTLDVAEAGRLLRMFAFDRGRFELLNLSEAPQLDPAQKARALKRFVFERAKAEALLK